MDTKTLDTKTLKETHEDVPPDYYDDGLKRSLIQRVWHRRRFRWISGLVSEVDGRVLDIGCDGATLTAVVAEKSGAKSVVGIDIAKESVAYSKEKHPEFQLAIGHAEELPFRDAAFDMVFCSEVLEHVEHPERLLSEIKRCMTADGYCIVEVPTESWYFKVAWALWTRLGRGRAWRHAHAVDFGGDLLDRMLNEAGFRVLQRSTFLGMLHAVKIAPA